MKNSGRANQTALKLILWTFLGFVAVVAAGYLATIIGAFIRSAALVLFSLWGLLAVAVYFYFRDPDPVVPVKAGVVVSPVHGKVVGISEGEKPDFMNGAACQKVTIKVACWDIPLLYAPVTGKLGHYQYRPGDWQGSTDTSKEVQDTRIDGTDASGPSIGVRMLAGRLGQRIQSWVSLGEDVERGQRVGMMQLGNRCEVFLPLDLELTVKPDDVVKGGETVLAQLS